MYHFKSHAGKISSILPVPGVGTSTNIPDHCLEVLRQGAMCAGDVSLTTVSWEPGKPFPGVDLNGRPRQKCVDWAVLMSSIESRVVSNDEYESMTNPLKSPKDMGQDGRRETGMAVPLSGDSNS